MGPGSARVCEVVTLPQRSGSRERWTLSIIRLPPFLLYYSGFAPGGTALGLSAGVLETKCLDSNLGISVL